MVKKRFLIVFPLAILLLAILIVTVIIFTDSGEQPSVITGVSEGDVFTYEVKGIWTSNDPSATISDSLLQLNMTEWYRVTITNISDSEVSTRNVWRLINGTEIEEEGKVDVETGIYSGGFWAIYSANLEANDRIRPLGIDQSVVNDTITREYNAGITRETSILLLANQYYNVNDPARLYTDYMAIEFDKQTGILVELHNEKIYTSPESTEVIWWTLTDSSVWTVS